MDNIGLWIYLSDVVDNAREFLTGVVAVNGILLLLVGICIFITMIDEYFMEDGKDVLWKALRFLLIALLITAPLRAIMPSQKTIAAMIVVPAIVNNEDISGIAKDSLKGLRALAADWVKELVEATKEEE